MSVHTSLADDLSPAVEAMSGGVREPVGWFRYQVTANTWTWSDGLYEIHGFRAGEIVPTTAVFLAHKHPDDRAHTNQVLAEVLATGAPYCCRHRIIDSNQKVRTVVTIGQGALDETGRVIEVHGYFVDISEAQQAARVAEIRDAVTASAVHRASIEQAKGALMVVHGITADDAFAVLQWHSQHANIRLRDLAERITAGISAPTWGQTPTHRISRILGDLIPGYNQQWHEPVATGTRALEPDPTKPADVALSAD